MKKIFPLIDLIKSSYPYEAEPIVDFTFCLLNILCVNHPLLFSSEYFKSIVKDLFEIEPLKILYTIQKLVTEDNLKLNNYFLEYLTSIFTRSFEEMMIIYS